ncbi:MAG: type II toxin-antitoxin system CcdA family antitoxin [Pseudomonadota bacterium]
MKRAANLSIDADLLDEAKALQINHSQPLEAGLRRDPADHRVVQWCAENTGAIEG